MTTLHYDSETFSDVPITNGHHAYAEGSEVLLVPYAWDDQPVEVVDTTVNPEFLHDQLPQMIHDAERVVIHNSQFDRTILAHHGVTIPVEKIHDTMVRALLHSLPGKLETLCDLLQVPQDKAKSKEGKRLIQLFTKPRPKNMKLRRATRETHPIEWAEFIEYARLDVVAMRECYKRLPMWNWTATEIALWRLDQVINDRGMAVDLDLARAALRAAARTSERLAGMIDGLTGGQVSSVTQRDRTLAYVRDVLGYEIADLKAATIETALGDENLDSAVREVLECRAEGAATAPAKYGSLLRSTSADGRLRGTIQFCGASRTGRDSGRIFQPQNLPRPKFKATEIELGIRAMKLDVEDFLFDKVMDLCGSALRGCIVAKPGMKLVIADLSNIEGRVVAWLAGEESKLAKFRDFDAGRGPDIYRVTAGGILGKRAEDISGDERQKFGKVPELLLNFGGAVGALQRGGVEMSEDEMVSIVRAWRKLHPNIVRLWYDGERAAMAAIENPGKAYKAGRLTWQLAPHDYLSSMLLKLPSGRFLCYPHAEIQGGHVECSTCHGAKVVLVGGFAEDGGVAHNEVCPECRGKGFVDLGDKRILYQGMNQYTRQWSVIDTWGGKLAAENPTQAVARDIFYHGARKAEAAGYRVVGRVHDELITEVPDTDEFTAEGLSTLMAGGPLWSLGLPLAAAGHSAYRYGKED